MNFALLFMSFTNSTWNFTHKINDISWWCWCCIIWTCFQSQLQHCAWVLEISLFWCWHLGPRPAGVSAVETNGSKPVNMHVENHDMQGRCFTSAWIVWLSELLAHVWLDMASSYLEVHKHMPQVTIEKVAFLRLESTRGHQKRSLILMATCLIIHSILESNII